MSAARYGVNQDISGHPLILVDLGPWDRYKTVTNAAEEVVEELAGKGLLPEGRRLLYWDSEGVLSEIVVDGGKFAGFKP